MVKCCFTSTETVSLLGTGAQDVHLDFHTAPELVRSFGKILEIDIHYSSSQSARAHELCESRGGLLGSSSLTVLMVSVDVKQH